MFTAALFTAAPSLVAATNLEFGGIHAASWVLIAIGVIGIVRVGFKSDDGQEKRRRRSIRASSACGRIGLKRFESLFESYAVGDYTGVVKDVRSIAAYLRQAGNAEEVAVQVIETAGPLLLENPLYAERVRKALTTKAKIVTVGPPKPAATNLEPQLH